MTPMKEREYIRACGRIPRLLFHIERVSDNPERVAGFKSELERHKREMTEAGYADLLKKLLLIKMADGKPAREQIERLTAEGRLLKLVT